MLAKKFRIGDRNRIEQILKKGHSFKRPYFYLRYLPNNRSPTSRFSVVVSKKLSPKAVERNRVKRRLYEAIRQSGDLGSKTCYDIVVLVSPKALKTPYETLQKEILFCLYHL